MRRAALALPLTALLLLSGCSADDDKASMDSGAAAVTSAPDGPPAAASPADPGSNLSPQDEDEAKEGGPKTGGTVISGRVQPAGDQIIKNARVSVAATDVDAARDKAVAFAKGAGGDVSSEQRSGTEDARTATIVFRVPPSDFDSLVTSLGTLGTVLDSTTETQDVTGEVADLRGRIGAAKDSAAKIRELIGKATAISDIVTLEREYQARDAEIQSMTAQLTALEDRAGRSTVTLSLSVRSKVVAEAKDDEASGFLDGLAAGWSAFTGATVVALTVLGALLPFLVLTTVALAVWLAYRRRRLARPLAAPAPSPYATAGTGAGAPPS